MSKNITFFSILAPGFAWSAKTWQYWLEVFGTPVDGLVVVVDRVDFVVVVVVAARVPVAVGFGLLQNQKTKRNRV